MLPRLLRTAHNRRLLVTLAWREVVARYKRSILGIGWALAEPLAFGLVYFVIFAHVARLDIPHYPYFLLAGLFPWTFLQGTINHCTDVMNENVNLIKKVYFPREIFVVSKLLSQSLNFGTCMVLLVAGALLLGPLQGAHVLWIVPGLALLILLAGTIGAALSVVTPHLRDAPYLVQFAFRLGVYATPIIYTPAMVPERWRWLLVLNPMTSVVELFHAAVVGGYAFDGQLVLGSALAACVVAGACWRLFRALEVHVAEVL